MSWGRLCEKRLLGIQNSKRPICLEQGQSQMKASKRLGKSHPSELSPPLLLTAGGKVDGNRLMLQAVPLKAINLSSPPSLHTESFEANLPGAVHSQINISQVKEAAFRFRLE